MAKMAARSSLADLSFGERALSAAGAAVNPLDVAKEHLCGEQGYSPGRLLEASARHVCKLSSGRANRWDLYMPCYDIFRNLMENFTTENAPNLTQYVPLVAGSAARSLACISCYPVELARTRMQAIIGQQAGTKPPGVWKTLVMVIHPVRSNCLQDFKEKNSRLSWARNPMQPVCLVLISLLYLLLEVWPLLQHVHWMSQKPEGRSRDRGLKGMFTGIGARVGRADPSVAIVVSFKVVKYALYHRQRRNND